MQLTSIGSSIRDATHLSRISPKWKCLKLCNLELVINSPGLTSFHLDPILMVSLASV